MSQLLRLVKDVGEVTFAAVLSVVHSSHEDACSAFLGRALPSQTLDLPIAIDLVVLEYCKLGLLALVLDLLGSGVHLLLPLLCTTSKAEDEMKSRLLLDVVVGEGTAIFELLAGEDQSLLVGRDAFLVYRTSALLPLSHTLRLTLNFGLDIVNGIRRLHLEGDSLAREGLDEDLHDEDLDKAVFLNLQCRSVEERGYQRPR